MSPVWVLVGPPGSGKSTVGRLLAERLGVAFRDTDDDLERRFAKPISEIFVDDGEQAFRAAEVDAVRAALTEHDGVLALGGGAPLRSETRSALAGHRVVFLDVSLSDGASRVGMSASRPLLMGNVRGTMKKLLDERRPVYAAVSTVTLDTTGLDPQTLADRILDEDGEGGGAS